MIAQVEWPETVEVRVTSQDIREGTTCNSRSCPVARAIARYGYATDVNVTHAEARVKRGGVWRYYTLPPEVGRFIERFDATDHPDRRRRIRPIAFTMTLIPRPKQP